jgi:hypothetical protein
MPVITREDVSYVFILLSSKISILSYLCRSAKTAVAHQKPKQRYSLSTTTASCKLFPYSLQKDTLKHFCWLMAHFLKVHASNITDFENPWVDTTTF